MSDEHPLKQSMEGRNWKPNRRPKQERQVLAGLAALVATFALMYFLDHCLQTLRYEQRPTAFLTLAAFFIFWPFAAKVVSPEYLFAITCFPLFAVITGLKYTSDIGPDSYFLEAQPTCFAGLWAFIATSVITYKRLLRH